MWKKDYCWILTYKGTNILTQVKPVILTFKTKWGALQVFEAKAKKIKKLFPKLEWVEVGGNPNNNKIQEYSIEALTNPDIYVKAYKSTLHEINIFQQEDELVKLGE